MIKGHVDISHITFDMLESLSFSEITDTTEAGGLWHKLGVSVPVFPSGAPVVHQTFGDTCPQWVNDVYDHFSSWLHHGMVTVNKLMPGCFIPPHCDTLYRIQQKVNNEQIDVTGLTPVRINLFLQDHQLGHIFEMNGKYLERYTQGDYAIILPEQLHSVANLGYLNRYTMQITGFSKIEDIT